MELCAEMLMGELEDVSSLAVEQVRPAFLRLFGRLPWLGSRRVAVNADRLLNRFLVYPRYLDRRAANFNIFHICDHSYSQLVHALPSGRAGVYCHDLGTFRCLLEPLREPRPRWFRRMVQTTLDGFRKAAIVFYSTCEVRRQILAHGLINPARLIHAPYGVAPEYTTEPGPDDAEPLTGFVHQPFLLHVGSGVARKRLDVLVEVFAAVHQRHPELRLIQVGGDWTMQQRAQLDRLGIAAAVHQMRGLARTALAALYRRAALVLLTSEDEGFGLPIIEALACGAVVVASDLPVLREVGDSAVVFCPVADLSKWIETVTYLFEHRSSGTTREERLCRASLFSWKSHARTIAGAYGRLIGNESSDLL